MTRHDTRPARPGDIVRRTTSIEIPEALRAVTMGTQRFHRPDLLEIRGPGGVSYSPVTDLLVICPGEREVERIGRAEATTLTHVAECPHCQETGCHSHTIDGWDRLWCRSCGHVWDLLSALLDEADIATCSECESTLMDERGECEFCSTEWARNERNAERRIG